jgi:hypothetical protein
MDDEQADPVEQIAPGQFRKVKIGPGIGHVHQRNGQRGDAAHGLDAGDELLFVGTGHAGHC